MTPPDPAAISTTQEAAPASPRGRGRPPKRSLKRKMLLDGAAELFNLRGISATSVADVADILGLSRASLYYYVDDREDLVFQCYLRACELTAEDLAAAAGEPTGLARTLAFVRHSLMPGRPTTAVLSEIDVLAGERAEAVKAASERNTSTLIGFIDQGIDDGSTRACDAEVIAQSIVGMLAWAQLLPQWSGSKQMQALRTRTSNTITSLLDTGLAVERGAPFRCRIDVEQFQRTLVNAFDRRESSSVKIDQVLAAASRLFNRNGIEATSVDSIAAALGVTKGVLYHYMADKSELVTRCYERAFDFYDQFIEVSKREGGRGLDRALINGHLNIQAHVSSLTPLMPQPGFGSVPEARRMSLMKRGRHENEVVADLLREGVADGSAVACDAAMVTHICAGLGWIPKWLPADDQRGRFQIADEICTVLRNGLRRD